MRQRLNGALCCRCTVGNIASWIPSLLVMTVYMLTTVASPTYAAWCEVCQTHNDSTTRCSALDLREALATGYATPITNCTNGTVLSYADISRGTNSPPVLAALSRADLLTRVVLQIISALVMATSASFCLALCFNAAACRVRILTTGSSLILLAEFAIVLGVLVFSSEALYEWQHDLDSGGFCGDLCRTLPLGVISCRAESAGRSAGFWVGPGAPRKLGPSFLIALHVIAVCNFVAKVLEYIGIIVRARNQPRPQLPWRADESQNGARVALLPKNIPTTSLGPALREAGCPTAVTDFVVAHTRIADTTFTCSVCWEEGQIGDTVTDLACANGMNLAPHKQPDAIDDPPVASPPDSPARHCFCPPCIAAALIMRPTCPLCQRRVLTPRQPGLTARLAQVHPQPLPQGAVIVNIPVVERPDVMQNEGETGAPPAAAAAGPQPEPVSLGTGESTGPGVGSLDAEVIHVSVDISAPPVLQCGH